LKTKQAVDFKHLLKLVEGPDNAAARRWIPFMRHALSIKWEHVDQWWVGGEYLIIVLVSFLIILFQIPKWSRLAFRPTITLRYLLQLASTQFSAIRRQSASLPLCRAASQPRQVRPPMQPRRIRHKS
jgi:hypothetical protein